MKTSHFFAASFGTLCVHLCIAYTLFISAQMLSKPVMQEFSVTQVSFLEEVKPTPLLEKTMQDVPQKIEPTIEKKIEKKVSKEVVKAIPLRKNIKESVQERAPSSEPFVEQTSVSQVTTSSTQGFVTSRSESSKDELLLAYLSKVRQKIQESLRYPSMAKKMGTEGEAVVQFLIHANGMVDASSIKIAKSSGKALLDRNAIEAVLEALPFELPPREEIEIKVPVIFKLTS